MNQIIELLRRVQAHVLGVQSVTSRAEADRAGSLGQMLSVQRSQMRMQLADALAGRIVFESERDLDSLGLVIQRAEIVVMGRKEFEDLVSDAYFAGQQSMGRPLVEVSVSKETPA